MKKQELLFGYGVNTANMPMLAKCLGVSLSTLHRWRREPNKMPLWAAIRIAKLRGLSDEQKVQILC